MTAPTKTTVNDSPPPMRIYVASSWKNEHQPAVVERLRAEGHEVYDFRTAAAFSWAPISEHWRDWTVAEWIAALDHPLSVAGFNSDMGGVNWCDVCVCVEPCGHSAGLEAGFVKGSGRPLIVYAPAIREAELMVKMADLITDDLDLVALTLKEIVRRRSRHPEDVYRDRMRSLLVDAMQDAWNDICVDSGCFPECIKVDRGRRVELSADFEASNFARYVADRLLDRGVFAPRGAEVDRAGVR